MTSIFAMTWADSPEGAMRSSDASTCVTHDELLHRLTLLVERLERLPLKDEDEGKIDQRPDMPTDLGPILPTDERANHRPQIRRTRPPLPDPRLIRRIIHLRQRRARYFTADLFADPAWDMLLDLTAARAEHSRVSITSLCIASGVPPTTALRWINQMVEAGLFIRTEDEIDRRRAFVTLSDSAAYAMAHCFTDADNVAIRFL